MPNLKLKFSMNSNLGRHAALIAARRMRRCAKLATDFLASLCTICFIRNGKIKNSNMEFLFAIIFLAAKLESASFTLIQL